MPRLKDTDTKNSNKKNTVYYKPGEVL